LTLKMCVLRGMGGATDAHFRYISDRIGEIRVSIKHILTREMHDRRGWTQDKWEVQKLSDASGRECADTHTV